jgi:hypothetical protein
MVAAAMTETAPAPTLTPPPQDTAEDLFAALRRLTAEGRVVLQVDPTPLHHIDSPVALEAEGNLWLYPVPVLAAALWWWQGIAAGLGLAAAGILLYLLVGRGFVHRRIERRVHEQALASLDVWRKLWRFKGLTLAAKDRPEVGSCASPDGNWMAFVRKLG